MLFPDHDQTVTVSSRSQEEGEKKRYKRFIR